MLYRNLGNWKFVDITEAAGVACPDQFSTGAAFADLDGVSGVDTVYVADDTTTGTPGGITKYSLVSGNWHVRVPPGARPSRDSEVPCRLRSCSRCVPTCRR